MISRDIVEACRFAGQALGSNRTRTLLTAFSMLIANAAVILVVSLALAGRDFVVAQIEGVGSNLIYAYYEAGGGVPAAEADYISIADVAAVEESLGDLAVAVAGVMSTWDWTTVEGRPQQIRILGANEQYRFVRNLEILSGRFLDAADLEDRNKVCLLTEELARKLHGSAPQALGAMLKIHGLDFQIVGVFREGVETFGQSEVASNSALIPLTVLEYFQPVERVDPLYVSVRSVAEVERAGQLVRAALEARHRPGSLYRVDNLTGVLAAAQNISKALTAVLFLVASVTLGIGGIFIMNIMLISVAERTKEIGVRMAVGATRRQVKLQFLLEAVGMSLLGGLAGVAVGVSIPAVANRVISQLDIPALAGLYVPVAGWSVVAALTVSLLVGVVFGSTPAARAAELDPVEALRHE